MPYAACSCANQPGTEAQLDPAAGHLVDLRDLDRQHARAAGRSPTVTRVPSRMRLVSRASPARVIHASVGPGSPSPAPMRQVVVGAEEGVEAEVLGGLGDGEQVVVASAPCWGSVKMRRSMATTLTQVDPGGRAVRRWGR